MKILHVINSLEVGGAQRLLSDLLPIMVRSHEVDLLVLRDSQSAFANKIRNSGVKIHSLHAKYLRNPMLIFKIRPYLEGYDVVHVHLFPALYWTSLALKISSKLRVVLCYTEHSTDNLRRRLSVLCGVEKFIYNSYSRIFCISRSTKGNLSNWINDSSGRLIVLPNGTDLAEFRKVHKASNEKRIVIMVSRFSIQKDQATLIRAMESVSDNVRLWLVGDGPTMANCKLLVEKLGLDNRVIFLGIRSDIPELLAQATIGVQSSHWEGFGLTAIEIMAAGLPLIATRVPGLADVVGDAGLFFKHEDHVELAGKINALLSDEEMYNEYVGRGQKRSEDFAIETVANRYLDEYVAAIVKRVI
ncbi:glycosyltransferase [Parabacteroides sp.]